MKKTIQSFSWVFVLVLFSQCSSKQQVKKSPSLTLLHQSNRWASFEPCGCDSSPYGGIDREFNAMTQINSVHPNVLFVDAGNAFHPAKAKAKTEFYQERSIRLTKVFTTLGLDVFAPGPDDFKLGLPFLKQLEELSSYPFIASNWTDPSGKQQFPPYVVVEKSGVRIAVLSATPQMIKDSSIKVFDPVASANRWISDFKDEADVIVLLSQLSADESSDLAKTLPQVDIIVGADPNFSSDDPFVIDKGRALYVDTHVNGNWLGKLDLQLRYPITGFKPYQITNEIQTTQASTYSAHLIRLDETRFGEKNQFTKWIADEKQRIRLRALAE